jgi:hypothetical protein
VLHKKTINEAAAYSRAVRALTTLKAMGSSPKLRANSKSAQARKWEMTEGISMEKAIQRADRTDVKEFQDRAAELVRDRDFSQQANDELRLYNLPMRVNRLYMLKAAIGIELVDSTDQLQKFSGRTLTEETIKEFERQAGILGGTVLDNQRYAKAMPNASFRGATFSEGLWGTAT